MSDVLKNAVKVNRKAYLNDRGYTGSNEGTPEQLEKQMGYVLTYNGLQEWISESLYLQLSVVENTSRHVFYIDVSECDDSFMKLMSKYK